MKIISRILIYFNIGKISKEKRLIILEQLLKDYHSKIYSVAAICPKLSRYANIIYMDFYMFKHFPEVYLQKPSKTYNQSYWFHLYDTESRIKCIENAIKILKK